MDLSTLASRIDQLVSSLRAFRGHRSIWLAPGEGDAAQLWHAEPDDDLHDQGCRYVATLMQPTAEALTAALLPALSLDADAHHRVGRWSNPDLGAVGLVPASAG